MFYRTSIDNRYYLGNRSSLLSSLLSNVLGSLLSLLKIILELLSSYL